MIVKVNMQSKNGANALSDALKAQIEEMEKGVPEKVKMGIREMAKLMARLNQRVCNAQAVPLGDVNRFNTLCYELFPGMQDGGEFCKEKAPEAENAQPVKTFDFGEAIRRVKGGARVARMGWNGPSQYIQLATEISYLTKKNGADVDGYARHKDIGSAAIVFSGTRGAQIGWLASQADMLDDDWYEVRDDG